MVIGPRNRSIPRTLDGAWSRPSKAEHSEDGKAWLDTGRTNRPRLASQKRLAENVSRHQRIQRRSVRRLTENSARNRSSLFGVDPSRSTGTSSTTTPKNTLRPKNLRDGGVTRRRQPSTAQQ